MIEVFELAASYWRKSKKDWHNNKHRVLTLFAFILVAYLVLEFGSYIFTLHINQERMADTIKTQFIDKRVNFADQILERIYLLKDRTRDLINETNKKKPSDSTCETLHKNLKITDVKSDLFVSAASIRYFFGDDIANEFAAFISWYEANEKNCFMNVPNAEHVIDLKVSSIRNKMWEKMYPPDIIKGIR